MTERTFPDGTRIDLIEHPTGEREAILRLDGQKISRTFIIPMFMRIGKAVVRMDGIGGVATEEEFRNRGFSRRVLEYCIDVMTAGDGAISTLYGIQDYYHKFGYATAGPEFTVSLPLAGVEIAAIPPAWTFRPLNPDDLPAVMRMYHEVTKQATGAVRRHEEPDEPDWVKRFAETSLSAARIGGRPWRRLIDANANVSCRILADPAGKIVAYACVWEPRDWWLEVRREEATTAVQVAEIMAESPMAADAIVSACRYWAKEVKPDAVRIYLDVPSDGFIASAASYAGGSVLQVYVRQGHFMARTLDPTRLINQMHPEFSARIRALRLNVCGNVTFRTDMGDASMSVTPEGAGAPGEQAGDQFFVELPQDTLARMCLGGFETSDLLERLPNPPDDRTWELMEVLFPRRHPHIYPLDRF